MKQASRERSAQILLLCWIGVWLGAFTLAKTKLPSYATPCFPAVALLAGYFVQRLIQSAVSLWRYWPLISFQCLIAFGLAGAALLPVVANRYLPGDQWLGVLGIVPMVGGLMAIALWWINRPIEAIASVAGTGGLLALGIFALGAHVVDRHQQVDRLLSAIHQTTDHPQVASFRVLEPGWVYYGRMPIREIRDSREEAAAFLAQNPQGLMITTDGHWRALSKGGLSADFVVLADVQRFLKEERLVLIGRSPANTARKPSTQR